MSKKSKRASIIASAVLGAGLAIGAATTGVLLANQPLDITYYANNGTPAVSAQIKKGDNLTLPTPTREGYNFAGWYADTGLTEQITSTKQLKQNSKLYAGWELANYELATANAVDTQAETQGLKSIGKYAFANSKITSVTIPDTVTTIGEGAFENCTNLQTITLGKNITAIEQNAFRNCESVTKINYNAKNCEDLSSNSYIFDNVGKSTDGVNINIGNSVARIPAYLFTSQDSTTAANITSVTMGENISSISANAWGSCANFSAVYISNITSWLKISFDDGNANPVYHAKNLYVNNKLLTTLVIPNDVTEIKNYAFYQYDKLTDLTIGSGITNIAENAFYRCSALETILVNPNNQNYCSESNILFNKNKTNLILCAPKNDLEIFKIPSTVTEISGNAFWNCSSLKEVFIPASVKNINASSYSNSIFLGCGGGLKVYCEASTRENTWGDRWNYYNSSAAVITIWGVSLLEDLHNANNGCTYEVISDSAVALVKSVASGELTIPSHVLGEKVYSVTKIARSAFQSNIDLTSVTIPDTVTTIGEGAFENCRLLRDIAYADRSNSNKTLSIEESAFRYCVMLQQIEIPAFVTNIGKYAFFNCSSAKNIILPTSSTLTTINDNTFARCSSITSLVIPDYITTLSNEAFSGCSNLANISIGKNVSTITRTTFNDCYNIKSIVVDSQNTTYNSMNNCNCLIRTETNAIVKGCKNSTIPDGVKEIIQEAFYGCDDLTSIYIPSSVTSIAAFSFYGCYRNLQIYCGARSKPSGWAENWNCYGKKGLTNLLYKDNVQVFWGTNRSDV